MRACESLWKLVRACSSLRELVRVQWPTIAVLKKVLEFCAKVVTQSTDAPGKERIRPPALLVVRENTQKRN